MIFISSAVTYFNKWGYFMIQNEKQIVKLYLNLSK
jgi:hypothetical protein